METERYRIEGDVLIIKEGVDFIKDNEFKGMDKIKKVVLPSTVDSIGNSAFAGCKSLRDLCFPDGFRWIWKYAFSGCIKLKKVRFPYTMEQICSLSFSGCKGLKEVVVPSTTRIDEYAFSGCDALEKVIIRDVKKLSPVQDIPGAKVYQGPKGPEVYVTDPKWSIGNNWVNLIMEAKMNCLKVRITYLETPESQPKTMLFQPLKLIQSVSGWRMNGRTSDESEPFDIMLGQVLLAELTDIHFEPEKLVF